MAQHYHVVDVMPAEVYATGVIKPYPYMLGPEKIAHQTISVFQRDVSPVTGPAVKQEPSPEDVARMAQSIAEAMGRGIKMPAWVDPRLIKAARNILEGRPFVIRSAGREAMVQTAQTIIRPQAPEGPSAGAQMPVGPTSNGAGPRAMPATQSAPGRTSSASAQGAGPRMPPGRTLSLRSR